MNLTLDGQPGLPLLKNPSNYLRDQPSLQNALVRVEYALDSRAKNLVLRALLSVLQFRGLTYVPLHRPQTKQ